MGEGREAELRLIRGWLRHPLKNFAARMAFHFLKRKHGFSPSPVLIGQSLARGVYFSTVLLYLEPYPPDAQQHKDLMKKRR